MKIQYARFVLFASFLILTACSRGDFHTPNASGRYLSKPVQCVPFARDVSRVNLYGDAHTWWDKAAKDYRRGHQPRPGAILVLASTKKLPKGHVAVVKDIISSREIEVTHSNWGGDFDTRRIAYDAMRAEDVSPGNDWSSLRFWNKDANSYGFPYPAKGFIYPY